MNNYHDHNSHYLRVNFGEKSPGSYFFPGYCSTHFWKVRVQTYRGKRKAAFYLLPNLKAAIFTSSEFASTLMLHVLTLYNLIL